MNRGTLSIQTVSERCGINPVTLRAWERRYGLIRPARTERGHRRYSEADVARIRRILAWLDRGLPIGQVRAVLDGQTPTALPGDPWREAGDEGLAALAELNTRRLEQWFQRLTGDYPLEAVIGQCCDPLREHLRARPDGAASRTLLDTFLRQKLAGRLLARAPSRRERGWLLMAVGDPLPALTRAVLAGTPVWCLETALPWSALAAWLAGDRVIGVAWVLGEHPGRRRAEQLWPLTAAPDRPALCAGPALTEKLITPPWLRRVVGDRAAFVAALDEHQQRGERGATGLVS
ncbi:MerR family transcriptional regulator [Alloalcanivorax sp. C16-2]|uniref:MerR family transcriptional regulator n=1 Tax=Alloalcanivorax TaxID=3020832 RepID=UPI001931A3B1|nr:MerR family transcriptional regulator [Alloalcanivorax marinus]MBL7250018.1 MerR family transcriptional regulator [Alloalcanivorax marinus]